MFNKVGIVGTQRRVQLWEEIRTNKITIRINLLSKAPSQETETRKQARQGNPVKILRLLQIYLKGNLVSNEN